ncbi:MAG: phosphotransferase [Calditrichaeota bacterium]|nr:MAG: phosphotransferase [Calditrichota bacterium]
MYGRCDVLDSGYWMLDTGCWILDAGLPRPQVGVGA